MCVCICVCVHFVVSSGLGDFWHGSCAFFGVVWSVFERFSILQIFFGFFLGMFRVYEERHRLVRFS